MDPPRIPDKITRTLAPPPAVELWMESAAFPLETPPPPKFAHQFSIWREIPVAPLGPCSPDQHNGSVRKNFHSVKQLPEEIIYFAQLHPRPKSAFALQNLWLRLFFSSRQGVSSTRFTPTTPSQNLNATKETGSSLCNPSTGHPTVGLRPAHKPNKQCPFCPQWTLPHGGGQFWSFLCPEPEVSAERVPNSVGIRANPVLPEKRHASLHPPQHPASKTSTNSTSKAQKLLNSPLKLINREPTIAQAKTNLSLRDISEFSVLFVALSPQSLHVVCGGQAVCFFSGWV